jgi:hypothetical protein
MINEPGRNPCSPTFMHHSLKRGGNETGERVSDADMRQLHLTPHTVCPAWNYTLSPRTVYADE